MNRVYLVRHGENLANITKEFSHRIVDYPLTGKGRLQAEQTADYFRTRQVDLVFSSPLKRALETAEIIAESLGLPVTVIEEFREINVGTLEEHPPTEESWRIFTQVIADWYNNKLETSFPGGEDFHTLRDRMRAGIKQVLEGKDGCNIVVVGHGGIFTTLINDICRNTDPSEFRTAEYHNCAITELEAALENGEPVAELIGWGFCEHLSGEAADLVSPIPESVREASGQNE